MCWSSAKISQCCKCQNNYIMSHCVGNWNWHCLLTGAPHQYRAHSQHSELRPKDSNTTKQGSTGRAFIISLTGRNSLLLNRYHQIQGDPTRRKVLSVIGKDARMSLSSCDHAIIGIKASQYMDTVKSDNRTHRNSFQYQWKTLQCAAVSVPNVWRKQSF